jgi:CheY-like chemotaxis protein
MSGQTKLHCRAEHGPLVLREGPAQSDMTARILSVDDNEAVRYVRRRVLERAGFAVIEAKSGEEALRSAAEHRPDLVLLDVRLGDANGGTICRRLKAERPEVAVVLISAAAVLSGDREGASSFGADAYVTEPVRDDELVRLLSRLLEKAGPPGPS